jgi:hypothetical protein
MAAGEDPFPWAGGHGDEDPFPLSLRIRGKVTGKWVKGRGHYRALQVGPFCEIIAAGATGDFNSEAALVPSPLTVFPPVYGLFFYIPEITMPAEKPFVKEAYFFSKETVQNVVIWDADGKHTVPVVQGPM